MEAIAILTPLAVEQRTGGRLGRLIATLTTLAVAHESTHDRAAALAALSEAVRLAGGDGYRRAFRDRVLPVAHLLAPLRHLAPTFVDDLRDGGAPRRPVTEAGDRVPTARPPGNGSLVEPLSVRELEVLRLVAAGLSNDEIGAALFITPGTAKWHVHNLLSKVGARNRVGLVAEARAYRLL